MAAILSRPEYDNSGVIVCKHLGDSTEPTQQFVI